MSMRKRRRQKYAMLEGLARTPLWARHNFTLLQRLVAVSRNATAILKRFSCLASNSH